VHPDANVAEKLRDGLRGADYHVVAMSSVQEAGSVIARHQFLLPDAILAPLGSEGDADSVLVALFESSPLMEQIPLVVVAKEAVDGRQSQPKTDLARTVFPPFEGEDVASTTRQAIEEHRSGQLFFGSLEQVPIADFLQMAEVGQRTGRVTFHSDRGDGMIWLDKGDVIAAEVEGGSRDEEAVYDIAIWSNGTFAAEFGAFDGEERLRTPPSTLLLEAMRRFDEESANGVRVPQLKTPSPASDSSVVDLSLVLLNVVGSYAINHLHPTLIGQRFEEIRGELRIESPVLDLFNVTDEGVVTVADEHAAGFEPETLVHAVSLWVDAIFTRLDEALAWRFSPDRLGRILAPWLEELKMHGFGDNLGIDTDDNAADDEPPAFESVFDWRLPVGCHVLDSDGIVRRYSLFGPRVGQVDPETITGKNLRRLLPAEIASLLDRLNSRLDKDARELEGVAIGREVLYGGHQELLLRLAVIPLPSGNGSIVTLNRFRDQRRSLSPEIERDPVTGSLRDGRTDRLIIANEDFLRAFEGMFARSLTHRHQQLLQRFGKKWGLRHAMRLEQVVQREYLKTLRESESQMALELLSSSLGVIGLGSFEADLSYHEAGLVVIRHAASPFPGIFSHLAGGACPILSGFHAALLSYLSGRQLAAREVHCSRDPGESCLFLVGTEERLSKLQIATPGSPDHKLLAEIVGQPAVEADR
jgi:predicted hydrocarbon binding protein